MSKRKRLLITICSLLLLGGIAWGDGYYRKVATYRDEVGRMTISDLDFTSLKDGVYIGSCDVRLIQVKVQVTVSGGRVEKVELLEHENGRGKPAEVVAGEVVRSQSLKVDTVAGATNSSKAILKAVERALENA